MIAINANVGITFFQDLVPDQPGLTTALYSNSMATGNLVGVLSFGFVVEWISYRGVFYFCVALSLIALAIIRFYRNSPQPTKVAV